MAVKGHLKRTGRDCDTWNRFVNLAEQYIPYLVEHNGSGVELRTLDYKNPSSNPVLRC